MTLKQMKTAIDHASDSAGTELHRMAQLYDFPQFVKAASSDTIYPDEGLTANVYADSRNMLYPCHNAASTWLSALYFTEKSAAYLNAGEKQHVEDRLDKMVKYWGIKSAVDAMKIQYTALHKEASYPDSAYAMVWQDDKGGKQRQLRMTSCLEVKAAADWLHQYRDGLPYTDRHVIAGRILEKAAKFGAALGAELDNFLEKQAGRGVCEPKEVVAMVRQRAHFVKNAEAKAMITGLADSIEKSPGATLVPQMLIKLAEVVDDVDRKIGLAGRYTEILKRPEDVLFKAGYKEARASLDDAVSLTTGRIYSKQALAQMKLADIQAMFGNDMADEVAAGLDVDTEKLAALVGTMPLDHAEQFEQVLKDAGVRPIHVKAGQAHRLDPVEWEALAASY